MLQENQIQQAIGATAYGQGGDKVGSVGTIFLDDETGQPEFATVNTGSSEPTRATCPSPMPRSTATG